MTTESQQNHNKQAKIVGLSATPIHGGANIIFCDVIDQIPQAQVILNRKVESHVCLENHQPQYLAFNVLQKKLRSLIPFIFSYVKLSGQLVKMIAPRSLLIANELTAFLYAIPLKARRQIELSYYCHSAIPAGRFNRQVIGRLINRYADRIIVPSNYLKAELRTLGIERPDIIVVPNAISQPAIPPLKPKRPPYNIGMFGLICDLKGQDVFAGAIRLLKQDGYPIKGLMVGNVFKFEQAYYEQLKADFAEEFDSGLLTHQSYLPRLEALKLMNRQHIVVAPSKYRESFSLVLIEAFSLKKAVVASRVGGMPEVINHEINGLLVPPNNVAALAKAIKTIIDGKRFELMGQKAFETYQERFTFANMVEHFKQIFSP